MRRLPDFLSRRLVFRLILSCAVGALWARCLESTPSTAKQAQKSAASEKRPELPAQIELLETRVSFEANGDSRKEVHTRVHINNELGASQFARLTFDYNHSFQQIEFTLVRITHEGGGTVDILPSAISDQPNPAVANAPAYQDIRVKSVRLLGLAPGDLLEYRVVTTTSHHPLAPDFWLDHTFDRSGLTSLEIFELDLPASRRTQIQVNPDFPAAPTERSVQGDAGRSLYRWRKSSESAGDTKPSPAEPDVLVTSFTSWQELADHLDAFRRPPETSDDSVQKRAEQLTRGISDETRKAQILYDFVVTTIATIDLPPASIGFRPRGAAETLSSGYGTPLDKVNLLDSLCHESVGQVHPAYFGITAKVPVQPPLPSLLAGFVAEIFIPWPVTGEACDHCGLTVWIDPALEVAPYGVVRPEVRGKKGLFLGSLPGEVFSADPWRRIPNDLPLSSSQRVRVDASLANDGTLKAKIHYTMRGDNELLLRIAFHQSPKEKWNEVAQLLALSDGFRGKITDVTASDPYATKEPFSVKYEIVQPKFVDWSKKPVRIPALLPQLGLPDPPSNAASRAASSTIDLGTPLDVETHLTLRLPPGTAARTPAGTSVERDYATFGSKYQVSGGAVTASRHLNFLLRDISADRAPDYNAFVHAVQSDEAQEFTLERAEIASQQAKPQNSTKKN